MPFYPPYAPWQPPPRKNEGKAVAALALGVLSVTCLGAFAGIPAIVLGALARRDIDRSQGTLAGTGLAAGGIVSGIFGTGISLVLAVTMLGSVLRSAGDRPAPVPRAEAPSLVPIAAGTRSYGTLDVVDLDEDRPFKPQLAEVARAAAAKGRTLILQTYLRPSRECVEIASALPDPRMQRALTNVTLVRVDVEAFEKDLASMRVDTDSVPWFYKLDGGARPIDAINADEWDENVPANMAPILAQFAQGTLRARRAPSPLGTDL